jgi:hypothetical protein
VVECSVFPSDTLPRKAARCKYVHGPVPPLPECPSARVPELEAICTPALVCVIARDSGQASFPLGRGVNQQTNQGYLLCMSVEKRTIGPGPRPLSPALPQAVQLGSFAHLPPARRSCKVTTARAGFLHAHTFPSLRPRQKVLDPGFLFLVGTHIIFSKSPPYVEEPAEGSASSRTRHGWHVTSKQTCRQLLFPQDHPSALHHIPQQLTGQGGTKP